MIFLFRFLVIVGVSLYGADFFTVSICTTSTYENAKTCEKNYLKNAKSQIQIIQDGDKFRTICGLFATHNEAAEFKKTLDPLAISQGAFIKKIQIDSNISNLPKKKYEKLVDTAIENIKKLPQRNAKSIQINDTKEQIFESRSNYDYIDILVDSSVNQMTLKSYENGKLVFTKNYTVSTARKNAKKPQGAGKVTQIAINPTWYPTPKTINYFKTKGVNLPKAVPPGHPQNYMGAAKINLTHSVDGKTIYRIHGTINDKTIGSYESSGCIRMKNKDAIEVASMLLDFSKHNNKDKINVILR